MARKVRLAEQFPALKIKLGTPNDLEIVRAIRDVSNARLRVDANAAWTPKQAIKTINALEAFAIEFVEQPVAASDLRACDWCATHQPTDLRRRKLRHAGRCAQDGWRGGWH